MFLTIFAKTTRFCNCYNHTSTSYALRAIAECMLANTTNNNSVKGGQGKVRQDSLVVPAGCLSILHVHDATWMGDRLGIRGVLHTILLQVPGHIYTR